VAILGRIDTGQHPFVLCMSNRGFTHSILWLVGGLEHDIYFSIYWEILGIIFPSDFHIFQRGGSTANQMVLLNVLKPPGSKKLHGRRGSGATGATAVAAASRAWSCAAETGRR
jgi:hypothetical protein